MSGNERCKMYKETQSTIKKLTDKGLKLDKNIYMSQIVLIKNDVTSNDENVKKTALEMLNFLLKLNIEEVEVELIKILHDNAVNKIIHNCILKSIKQKLVDTILENKFNFTDVLAPWQNQNTNKLTNIIEDICVSDLPKDKLKVFFINKLIPSMLASSTKNQIRDALIDIAFMMSTILPISDLSTREIEKFLKDVNDKYVISIGDLRDKDYRNWHSLWIFLVRFCDKHIHHSMELTNKLLRVVEFAFRNSSIDQRLKGYDCWKELIDNASLDMNHMCSAKQIKLLITPLKAKFSKQEVVICKRFDVFTYLLEKLQQKAVLCLTEFLEFCFGPIGDNTDVSKIGQGKGVPQIWSKSTKVLIEVIGHGHDKTVSCLSTEDVIKLEKPIINCTNISNYYKAIINSVKECCTLLKDADIESKRDTVLKCLWTSVFNLVMPATEVNRNKYFQIISEILNDYIQQSTENPYFEDLLTLIFSILMSYDDEQMCEVLQLILNQLVTILFTVGAIPLDAAEKFQTVLVLLFSKIVMAETKLKLLKNLVDSFSELKLLDENARYAGEVWLCAANELNADLKADKTEKLGEGNEFFMWPAYHLHQLDDVVKKKILLHWMKIYRKITTETAIKKLVVMNDLQKIFVDNPLLNSNVVSLLNIMSQFETKFTKQFVNKIMMVSSQILQLPNLKPEEEQKITAIVMQYFEPPLECYKGDNNEEVVKNVCTCIKYILNIHRGFKILDTLTIFMKNSPLELKLKFSKQLSILLLDLFNKETNTTSYNAKELQKILQVLNIDINKKDDLVSPFIPPSGRSARIAHMAKNSPHSPHRKTTNAEPSTTALRLFGKDLDNLSPVHVKGSQLNNTTNTPKSKKTVNSLKTQARNSPSINDEKSTDFVLINTEVKLQPEKLSNHQKEMLKKRREDIPALYQDLSQSLSQDMFSSSSSSKAFEQINKENSDAPKVIVEVIGDHFKDDTHPVEEKKTEDQLNKPGMEQDVSENVSNTLSDATLSSEIVQQVPHQSVEDLNLSNTNLNFDTDLIPDEILSPEIINEEVVEAFEEINVPNKEINIEHNLFNPTVEGEKIMDPGENMIEIQKDLLTGDSGTVSKSKAKSSNLEQIEPLVGQKPEKPVMEVSHQVEIVVEENESGKILAEEKKRRGRQRIELELQKLKMNIVGAEEFLTASRRTRTREKSKKFDDTSNKKTKSVPKDEKLTNRSFSAVSSEPKEPATEKNRRKTIGAAQESKSNITDVSKNQPEDKFKDSETPKTRGKRKELENVEKTPKNRGKKKATENRETDKGEKRKRSSLDEESEDIIESSQEFHADVTPIFSLSKRKSFTDVSTTEQKLEKTEEETIVQQKTVFSLSKRKSFTDVSTTEQKLDKSEEETIVQQKTVTQEDFLSEIVENFNEAVKEDIPTNAELREVVTTTEVEEIVCTEEKQPENKLEDVVEIQPETNISQDTTMTQESTQDLTQLDNTGELESQNGDTETQHTEIQTQDTLTQSELSTASENIHPPLLYFDLPKRPELTESEKIMCRMDTMSICIDPQNLPSKMSSGEQNLEEVEIRSESPNSLLKNQNLSLVMEDVLSTPKSKASSSLPSSPITTETPTRTSELLNNTMDISPISSKGSSDDGQPEVNRSPVTINFKADMEALDEIERENILELIEKKSQECQGFDDQEPQKQLANLNENNDMPVLLGDILTQLEEIPNPPDEENQIKTEEISHRNEQSLDNNNVIFLEQAQNENRREVESTPLEIEETQNQLVYPTPEIVEVAHLKPDMPLIDWPRPTKDSNIQERASKLLNMVNVSSSVTHKIFMKKRSLTMSPSTARIKRLMSNCNQKSISEEIPGEVKEEDLLTFSREVPSPLAVPRSSILKRKISDSSESDSFSPCAKRKRVNFSDPCLTSKKLFIKDDYQLDFEADCIFDAPPDPKLEDSQSSTVTDSSNESSGSERFTETENFETEPTLEIVNPLILKKDKPIYPKLVDCQESVILILKRVTSPMFITTLMNKLKNKEIKTIGDLARQSETEINRFPFKVPVVTNVYKALDNYYKKNVEKFAKDEVENRDVHRVNGTEVVKRQGVIRKTSPNRVDLRVELRELIKKSKTEGTFQELAQTLLSSVEKQELLNLVKNHYKLDYTDFLSETDFKCVVKHITQKVGIQNMFEMLTGNIQNTEEESVYFDCIMKQSLEKKSLSNIWENRTIDDIKKALDESITRQVFSKQEIVDQCLLPLIENPKDISSYLNKISVVQLSDIVIERLDNADLTDFFRRILDSYSKDSIITLSKEVLVRIESPSDVVSVFQDCIHAQNAENKNEIMIKMFKFISGELSAHKLLELHVDFLKRIPSVMGSSEK